LERNGFWASNDDRDVLSGMREVEVLAPVISGVDPALFPRNFGWDDVVQLIPRFNWYTRILYRNAANLDPSTHGPAINRYAVEDRTLRILEGLTVAGCDRKDIHVIWLSADVFISTFDILLDAHPAQPRPLWDYSVSLSSLQHAYSLELFEDDGIVSPDRLASMLPLDFLGNLTTPLPASLATKFVTSLTFTRNNPQTVPVEFLIRFLSIVPLGHCEESRRETGEKQCIRFHIGNAVSKEELQVLLAYPFHPVVALSFCRLHDLHESVSWKDVHEALRGRLNLRRIDLHIPTDPWFEDDPDVVHWCEDITFESCDLSISYSSGLLTLSFLDIAAATHGFKVVSAYIPGGLWSNNGPELCQSKLRALFQKLFLEFHVMERLEIYLDSSREYDMIELLSWISLATNPCRSSSLCSFRLEFVDGALVDLDVSKLSDKSLDAHIDCE
jgi:hypothetical protein